MARAPLTRDAIVDAALALVDEGGLEALSMRAIGNRLGVQAMSLYNHVENKAALIDALHERLILSISLSVDGLDWLDAFRASSRAYRKVAADHPQAFVLLATRPLTTAAEVQHVSPVMMKLADAGFGTRQQLLLLNLFFMSLNGILLAEVAPVPGHSDVPEPDSIAMFRQASAQGSGAFDSARAIADLVEDVDEADVTAMFEHMVEVVLTGMATVVPDSDN
jgi:AcrR family transcriptional regulator